MRISIGLGTSIDCLGPPRLPLLCDASHKGRLSHTKTRHQTTNCPDNIIFGPSAPRPAQTIFCLIQWMKLSIYIHFDLSIKTVFLFCCCCCWWYEIICKFYIFLLKPRFIGDPFSMLFTHNIDESFWMETQNYVDSFHTLSFMFRFSPLILPCWTFNPTIIILCQKKNRRGEKEGSQKKRRRKKKNDAKEIII